MPRVTFLKRGTVTFLAILSVHLKGFDQDGFSEARGDKENWPVNPDLLISLQMLSYDIEQALSRLLERRQQLLACRLLRHLRAKIDKISRTTSITILLFDA